MLCPYEAIEGVLQFRKSRPGSGGSYATSFFLFATRRV